MDIAYNTLSNFDYVVILIIFLSSMIALAKGFIRTSISFLGWILIFYLSFSLYYPLLNYIKQYIKNDISANITSSLVGFVISVMIISLINNNIMKLTKDVCGGLMDRTIGFAFGFLRGCIIVCIVFWSIALGAVILADNEMLSSSNKNIDKVLPVWLVNAKTFKATKSGSEYFISFMPKAFHSNVEKFIYSFKHTEAIIPSPEQMQLINKMIMSLPPEITKSLSDKTMEKFKSDDGKVTNKKKLELLNDIVSKYKKAEKDKKIGAKQSLSKDEIGVIEKLLSSFAPEKEEVVMPGSVK